MKSYTKKNDDDVRCSQCQLFMAGTGVCYFTASEGGPMCHDCFELIQKRNSTTTKEDWANFVKSVKLLSQKHQQLLEQDAEYRRKSEIMDELVRLSQEMGGYDLPPHNED